MVKAIRYSMVKDSGSNKNSDCCIMDKLELLLDIL